jgi:MalK-like protein
MNFMAGTLEEGKLRTGLGDIPVSGRLQQELSGSTAGRDVIVGIRPEDFEDAALVHGPIRHSGITFPATIDVVESLGSEKFVYFSKELGSVETAELAELARDSGRADTGSSAETVVARIDPATRITEGQDAELWVDVRSVHVFDPATGKNLTVGDSGSPAAAGTRSAGDAAASAQADVSPAGTGTDSATGTGTESAAGTGTDSTAGTGTESAAGTGTD